jgi:hypothetical protein
MERLEREMTGIANDHLTTMQGMTEREASDYVKKIIANATIVFGVYRDAEAPNGVGMHVIKGKRELQVSIASGETIEIRTDAVPCIELEQVIAAEQVYGDGQLKSDG